MELAKAIKILELAHSDPGSVDPMEYVQAEDLSVEAMKEKLERDKEKP